MDGVDAWLEPISPGELAARLREVEAEREALQITAKTIRAMAASLDLEQPPPPVCRTARPISRSWRTRPGTTAAARP
ncbi:hypothetical protein ACGFWI_34230 [Streptomyces sp. NPDC048434]|uniref:hypothetical protein n=1 Tax=Streptomyces sp. NPDC048434 TaxID=3365549 RepID=UPI00372120E2